MEVHCPRCGYSWRPRASRRTKRFTCPNCNYSFVLSSDVTTTATATTTTSLPREAVRELYRLPSGHRVIEVVVDGYTLRFLCTADLSACDSERPPDGLPEEVVVRAIELLQRRELRVVETSSKNRGIEVFVLR